MDLATMFVRIRADRTEFDQDLKKVEEKATSAGRTIAGVFAQVFSAAAFGAGIKKSIDAASNLNETVSKTKVIFDEDAKAMEKMAETAARSMGMSKRAYLDAASGLKGLLDNMGMASDESTKWSQDMTQLGGDLASFFNTQPADAIYAISAALRGESEPIRRYNVQLSDMAIKQKAVEMGLYSGKGALDMHAKSQAALAVIMEQTTAAQGDFARTADGAANSQRIAAAVAENSAASLGQSFLPVYTRVVQIVTFLTEAFGKLPGPVQVAVVALIGMLIVVGPLTRLHETISTVTAAISGLSTASKVSLGVIGGLLAVAGVLFSIFSDGDKKTKDVAGSTDDLAASLKQSTAELLNNADAILKLKEVIDPTTVGMTTLSDAILNAFESKKTGSAAEITKLLGAMGYTAQDAAGMLGVLGNQIKAGTINQQALAEALTGTDARTLSMADAAKILGGSLSTAGTPGNKLKLLLQGLNTEIEGGIPNVDEMAKSFIAQATGASQLTADLVKQAQAQAESNGQGDNAVAVYVNYITAAAQLGDKQRALALDLGAAAAAGAAAEDEMGKAAVKIDTAAAASDRLGNALTPTTETLQTAADAADQLRKSIDAIFGGAMGLEEANRALRDGVDSLTVKLKENGLTLDISTAKGRDNRKAVEDQVNSILDYGVAMVAAGRSNEEATGMVAFLTDGLRQQLEQAGLTEDQVNDYLDTLGLTPASVTTALQLANDDAMKTRLQDLLDGPLKDLDEGTTVEIMALVDDGKFAEADVKVRAWAATHGIVLPVEFSVPTQSDRPSGNGVVFRTYDVGGFIDRDQFARVHRNEVVLPLSNPSRVAELLRDPRVAPAIEKAHGRGGAPSATQTSVIPRGRQPVSAHWSPPDPDEWGAMVAKAIASQLLQLQRAG